MGKPNQKKVLIEKIAKEQNLDPKPLWALPMQKLKKMDEVVADDDGGDLLGSDPELPVVAQSTGDDAASDGSTSTNSKSPSVSRDNIRPGKVKKYIGNHPTSDEPIYE